MEVERVGNSERVMGGKRVSSNALRAKKGLKHVTFSAIRREKGRTL